MSRVDILQEFPRPIISGEWEMEPEQVDYRSEWLSDMLVERATWSVDAAERRLGGMVVARPGYVWFRFWLAEQQQLVDRYFTPSGGSHGTFVPVCTPLVRQADGYRTAALILCLWIDPSGQVTVLGEAEFDQAAADGRLSAEQVVRAESHIRFLTTALAQDLFPPALVRNFSLDAATITTLR